ncbi:hypothetical protein VCHENC02_1548B, partial [Vibrio harveyi]
RHHCFTVFMKRDIWRSLTMEDA